MSELRELLAKSGLTRLVADEMPPDCKEFEPGWRIHDMPENSSWAQFLAEGLEKGEADLIVAAVNNLPALLDRIEDLQLALNLALEWLGEYEPGDSRAVSNEFVAMAAIEAGQIQRLDECRQIIRAALRSRQSTGERE